MHMYIVFCHPSKKSFTFGVLESVVAGLREAGHTYEVGDLYGERPAASRERGPKAESRCS